MTDDDDNDDTPRTHVMTDSERREHYATYPPGTLPVAETLVTPRNLFEQRLDTRLDRVEAEVDSLNSSRRFWRWIAGLGIPALLSAMLVVLLWSADRVSASAERVGETTAEIRALGKLIDLLEAQVAELRRRAGIDKPIVDGRVGVIP
jgi:hypothetical protein